VIKSGVRTFRSVNHKHINLIWNKKELSEQENESVNVHICKNVRKITRSKYTGK